MTDISWREFLESRPHCPIPPPPHPTFDVLQVVRDAINEDAGRLGDITTKATIPPGTTARAEFLCKQAGVIAGLGIADLVLSVVDPHPRITWLVKDGDAVSSGQPLGHVEGPAASILVAERVMLNFMQRMSGIASLTASMVDAVQGYPAKVLDTRKTLPGLRLLDKWAVLIGGGANHRMGLFDMMMIKDNHIAAAGGIAAAVKRAEEYIRGQQLAGLGIEVEARTMEEVKEVLDVLPSCSYVCRLMLDNMAKRDAASEGGVDISMLREAVELVGGAVETEASGNVALDTIRQIASTGVSYISCGALTHSVKAMDISLNIITL